MLFVNNIISDKQHRLFNRCFEGEWNWIIDRPHSHYFSKAVKRVFIALDLDLIIENTLE